MSSTAVLAAYALASLANPKPSQGDVEKIAKAASIQVPKDTISFVFESIENRDVNELINEGIAKLSAAAVASAGAPAGGATGAAAPAGGAAPAAGKPAEESESDDEIGLGLFD